MTRAYSSIYLSPHADDVVFSCAGRIWAQRDSGQSVLIATVTTADPTGELSGFARRLHKRSGMRSDSVELRRQEDRQASEILETDLVHGDLPDALYRVDPENGRPLYPSLKKIFRRAHPGDKAFQPEVERLIADLPAHEELVVPLAVGGHVDHRLVRRAAERIATTPLLYYEDFPYSEQRRAVDRALERRKDWEPRVVSLSIDALAAKHHAAAAYTSQVELIFGGSKRLRRAIQRYQRRIGGERYWHRLLSARGQS